MDQSPLKTQSWLLPSCPQQKSEGDPVCCAEAQVEGEGTGHRGTQDTPEVHESQDFSRPQSTFVIKQRTSSEARRSQTRSIVQLHSRLNPGKHK